MLRSIRSNARRLSADCPRPACELVETSLEADSLSGSREHSALVGAAIVEFSMQNITFALGINAKFADGTLPQIEKLIDAASGRTSESAEKAAQTFSSPQHGETPERRERSAQPHQFADGLSI